MNLDLKEFGEGLSVVCAELGEAGRCGEERRTEKGQVPACRRRGLIGSRWERTQVQRDCRCECETQHEQGQRQGGGQSGCTGPPDKATPISTLKPETNTGVFLGPCSALFLRLQQRHCVNHAGTVRPKGPLGERFPAPHTGFQGAV